MQDYADLIYDGLWFTGTHQDLAAFTASMQRHVSGTSRVKLYKGQAVTVGVESPNSLYQYSLATYDEGRRLRPVLGGRFHRHLRPACAGPGRKAVAAPTGRRSGRIIG